MTLTQDIERVSQAFKKKEELENKIEELIRQYELQTGLKITGLKFRRAETIRGHSPNYTELSIILF